MGSNNDNDLVVTYRSGNSALSFVLCRLKFRDMVLKHLRNLKEESEKSKKLTGPKNNGTEVNLRSVPPDLLLNDMEIVVSKTIKNVTIKHVYDQVWANETFYGSWLEQEECFDVAVEDWKFADPKDEFRNEWCKEKYSQKRLVTFKFNRTTHLYIGPPVAFVKQHQFCRVEGDDKCVLAILGEFEGIPYSDAFEVHLRWVASRMGENVKIQVGLFVLFKKNTMLKSQIKSGTIAETKNVHLRFFDAVKKACRNTGDLPSDKEDPNEEEEENIEESMESNQTDQSLFSMLPESIAKSVNIYTIGPLIGVASFLFLGRFFSVFGSPGQSDTQRLGTQIQELHEEVRALRISVDLVTALLKEMKSDHE